MRYNHDDRIVMTLDAGGTNFVFCAMKAEVEIVEPIRISAAAETLDEVLNNIVSGFEQVKSSLKEKPVAISFAFPGPADYKNGIIGDLQNIPVFCGGVALGPMLEEKFGIPVFINNDGHLFAYGEAIAGLLPDINKQLEEAGNPKRFKSLFGITIGTGFGGGLVIDNQLIAGDNGSGSAIWTTRNKIYPDCFAEEGVAIRAVRRVYAEKSSIPFKKAPEPKVIGDIALGKSEGNVEAAKEAWRQLGIVAAESLANAICLVDSLIVVGGGLSGSYKLFMPSLIEEMNTPLKTLDGIPLCRTEVTVLNLEDEAQKATFLKGEATVIKVPGSDKTVIYDPLKRTGVGVARLETSVAIAVGAYTFALNELDKIA